MAAAFKPVHADRVAAYGLGLERVAHRGAFVDHFDIGFMQRGQPFLRVVACGFHHFDAAFDDGADVAGVIGRADGGQEGQVDAKRLVCHVAAAPDFGRQCFGAALG